MRISDWSSDVCSSDLVGCAKAAIQPPADLDQHGVAGFVAVAGVDAIEVVDADHHIDTGLPEALRLRERMLQSVTQTHLVEVAGQVVEVGEILEAIFLLLALGTQADDNRSACRSARRREHGG